MKKLIVIWVLSISFFNAEGEYVLPAEIDKKGTLEWHSYAKGYTVERDEGSQQDLAFKYRIKWTAISNLEVYVEPPLIRYHSARDTSCAGIGDSDIGVKALFTQGIGGYAFLRLPTGAKDKPQDDWAPKFSNGKLGGGGKLIFTQELVPGIKAHLNIGFLANTGDLISVDNPIPANRIPLGASIGLPYGIFVEGETDMNRYEGDTITIADNPKRAIVGINYEYRPGIKFLVAFEYGTWGTGDPPIHKWSYGQIEDISQWDITLGVTYTFGVKVPPKVKPEVIAMEDELNERDKKIAEMRQELVEKETEIAKLQEENVKLKEEVEELVKKTEYGMYEVKSGECLWKIAKAVYGRGDRWPLIYDINKEQIKNPALISPKQKFKILRLPESK